MAKKSKVESIEKYKPLSVKERVIKDMKGLGVYKTEYDNIITIYCDLLTQYDDAQKKFIDSDYQYETSTAAGGTKKSAIVATLENLRKDIIAYSDRLCLNPRAIENITTENKKQSSLADILSEMR
ncbi:TPA: P27 family phage terminase small subunit [Listeria innocua]|uniref:Lin2580 protein n=1 Tax=Listeria innocua serovar 6a (strain ATCC BAA-680 / CLIP 11262) TaxID=272626 RepID=Q928F5_LISIN|nr:MULTISPECIES: P27 family phage terminase small subunit [Listeria]EAC3432699.1 P27 family phage terminase small subunit [Listeria monocytogenes]EAC9583786.1 P27 family phage terminase small subunit [Listeria monocytogenes]EAD0559971.1 P27 family phage terminase small subunit [Listeria monocytogenes]EAD1254713.1 P27 family phage terminase small subunit [Listeria monocytogenes]EAD2769288.1 P27 family phage terminase small subunit [Listeria monocytogenes]